LMALIMLILIGVSMFLTRNTSKDNAKGANL